MHIIRIVNGKPMAKKELQRIEIQNETLRSVFANAICRELRKENPGPDLENVSASFDSDGLL